MRGLIAFLHEKHGQNSVLRVKRYTCESLWLHIVSVLLLRRLDLKALVGSFSKVLVLGAQISHHQQVFTFFGLDSVTLPKQKCEFDVSMVFLSLVRLSRNRLCSVSLTVMDIQCFHCVGGCFRHHFGVLINFAFHEKGKRAIMWPPWVAKLHALLLWPTSHLHCLCDPALFSPPSRRQLRLLLGFVSEDINYWRDTQYEQKVWFLPHTTPVGHQRNVHAILGLFHWECIVEAIMVVSDFWHLHILHIFRCKNPLVIGVEWDLILDGKQEVIRHELEITLPYLIGGNLLRWVAIWGHAKFLNMHTSYRILDISLCQVVCGKVVCFSVRLSTRTYRTIFNGRTVNLAEYLQCHDKENLGASTVRFQNKDVADVQYNKVLLSLGIYRWFL
ncbi:unnamed protein product [Brassica oleracea var. botrytis]